MPAFVFLNDKATRVPAYSVIGMWGADTSFVQHVAIVKSDTDVRAGDAIEVWHMGPPLVSTESVTTKIGSRYRSSRADVAGMLDILSVDDREGIKTWLARVEKQVKPAFSIRRGFELQYIVHPPAQCWEHDEQSGIRVYRRFSCSGFVVACYHEGADISLIDWSAEDLPLVERALIESTYGSRLLEDEGFKSHLGIPGDGPWKIVLAGYVVHAFGRTDGKIRAKPLSPVKATYAFFPEPEPESSSADTNTRTTDQP